MNHRQRPLSRLFALLILLCPLLVAAPAAAEEANRLEIVDRAIAFHGGDRYLANETKLKLCSKSGCTALRAHRNGGLYDYEASGSTTQGEMWVRTTNDAVEYRIDGVVQSINNEQVLRDWMNSKVYFCFLPFRLNDPSVVKEDLGIETWNGRKLHKVKVTFLEDSSTDAEDEYLYWFDPKTARLEQFAYSFQGNPGGLRFRSLHEYRRVGGILFFDQKNLGVANVPSLNGKPPVFWNVDQITPEFVSEKMVHISDVELRDIAVSP